MPGRGTPTPTGAGPQALPRRHSGTHRPASRCVWPSRAAPASQAARTTSATFKHPYLGSAVALIKSHGRHPGPRGNGTSDDGACWTDIVSSLFMPWLAHV